MLQTLIELIKRMFIPRFEKAYIDLYNGRITADQFAAAAGIKDKEKAWDQLNEYRRKVVNGEIPDPRDKYRMWRDTRW